MRLTARCEPPSDPSPGCGLPASKAAAIGCPGGEPADVVVAMSIFPPRVFGNFLELDSAAVGQLLANRSLPRRRLNQLRSTVSRSSCGVRLKWRNECESMANCRPPPHVSKAESRARPCGIANARSHCGTCYRRYPGTATLRAQPAEQPTRRRHVAVSAIRTSGG